MNYNECFNVEHILWIFNVKGSGWGEKKGQESIRSEAAGPVVKGMRGRRPS